MAGNAVQIIIQAVDKASKEIQNVNKSLSDMDKTAGGSEKSISGIGSSLKGMVGTLSIAAGAVATFGMAAKQAFDLGQEGASLLRLEESSGKLAGSLGSDMDKVVQAVSRASLGMVSEMDIMAGSSRAMMLGVTSDSGEMAQLMEIAASKARAMGITTTQAFNDIVTGIGRGSPLILDNLGIIVNATETNKAYAESIGKTAASLTEAEKTQALLNRVLEEGSAQLDAVGGLTKDAAASFEILAANSKNFGDALKKNFAPAMAAVADLTNQVVFGTKSAESAIVDEANAIKASGATRQEQIASLKELIEGTNLYIDANGNLVESFATQQGQMTRIIAENYLLLDSYEKTSNANNAVAEAQSKANAAMADGISNIKKLYEGSLIYNNILQSQSQAAAQTAIETNNLAISMKGADKSQVAGTMIEQLRDIKNISPEVRAELETTYATWGGLANETSRALAENMRVYLENVSAGNQPLMDQTEILNLVYEGARDGKPDIDKISGSFKNLEVSADTLSGKLGKDTEALDSLNQQLPPAVEKSAELHKNWSAILAAKHDVKFKITWEGGTSPPGVAFNQPNNSGTRPGMIGTAHGGEGTVPAGYNSDSFPIFTRSGEKVTVQTPPQKFETDQRYETIIAMLSAQRPATAAEIGIAVRDAIMMIPG